MKNITWTEIKNLKGLSEIQEKLEIKSYLGFKEKHELVNFVVNKSVNVDNSTGKKLIDYAIRDMLFEMAIVKYYTNIAFDTIDSIKEPDKYINKMIGMYDILKSTGVVDYVLEYDEKIKIQMIDLECVVREQIKEEIRLIENEARLLEIYYAKQFDDKFVEHTVQEQIVFLVKDCLDSILAKIPSKEGIEKFVDENSNKIKEMVAGLDPKKMGLVDIFNKLNVGDANVEEVMGKVTELYGDKVGDE